MALARRYDLIQTAVDWEYARQLNELGVPIRVHVAVDTGMHRLGERWEHLERICAIYAMEHLRVEGIFTHLCADDTDVPRDRAFTASQADDTRRWGGGAAAGAVSPRQGRRRQNPAPR